MLDAVLNLNFQAQLVGLRPHNGPKWKPSRGGADKAATLTDFTKAERM